MVIGSFRFRQPLPSQDLFCGYNLKLEASKPDSCRVIQFPLNWRYLAWTGYPSVCVGKFWNSRHESEHRYLKPVERLTRRRSLDTMTRWAMFG